MLDPLHMAIWYCYYAVRSKKFDQLDAFAFAVDLDHGRKMKMKGKTSEKGNNNKIAAADHEQGEAQETNHETNHESEAEGQEEQ